MPITIFLVEDHRLIRESLTHFLSQDDRFHIGGEASTTAEALQRIDAAPPDVALLDIRLPDGDGIELCREIRSRWPETHCLMLSSVSTDDTVTSAILAGASGYLLKDSAIAEVKDAIVRVAAGESLVDPKLTRGIFEQIRGKGRANATQLTNQEERILELIGEGLTNREIARRLHLAEQTVKNYVSNVLAKLGLQSRVQAAIYATDHRAARAPE